MNSDDSRHQPRNVLPDLVIPLLALGFTVYYLTTITEVPWISQASAVTVSGLLIAAIVAYLIRTAVRIRRGSEIVAMPGRVRVREVTIRRIGLLALTVAYVGAIETLGFTLTTVVFIFFGVVLLSSWANWKSAALASVCCSVTGYVVFIYFFETRFPKGPVENALQGMF